MSFKADFSLYKLISGGVLEGNFGTGVPASFFKTFPDHIPGLGKK